MQRSLVVSLDSPSIGSEKRFCFPRSIPLGKEEKNYLRQIFFPMAKPSLSGFSFSGDTQEPPGRSAVQPALGDPAWAGGWAG